MQIDHIKPALKAPGSQCLELKYDLLLSHSVINFNASRYNEAIRNAMDDAASRGEGPGASLDMLTHPSLSHRDAAVRAAAR